ncbi:hypothetical protein [Spiroplasma endosymbiont of Polydrusus pterygomalis]|uniref:hypothetical protein n=1 Tax=Spiroplasma endosymbiont of Polydrusus pterygomalis TaxID=3139327 RepID=UPI003CCB43EF
MELSKIQIKSMWTKLTKKIKHRAFPATTFIAALSSKSEILALFTKNGEDTNQLEQIGFIICTKTIFAPSSDGIVSDQGIITNEYFTGEIIDVNNTLIANTYIHLVKVNSGPVVINDIPLYLTMNENYHQLLVSNKIGAKLFANNLAKQLNCKISRFNCIVINAENFIITLKNLKITRKKILKSESTINFLLAQKLSLEQLVLWKNKNKYNYLKKFNNDELREIINLQKIAVIAIKNDRKQWKITLIAGNKQRIENFFINVKKPIIIAINAINKKIKAINEPESIQPIASITNVTNYQELWQLQKIHKKLLTSFSKWRVVSQDILENLSQTFAYGYYSEVIDNLKIAHYSFNNDLLDYNLMEIKGRNLLVNANNTILFLSNNIIDNPSMVILLSEDLKAICDLKTIVAKIEKKQQIKIVFKNDIVIFSTNNYQNITDFITKMIIIFKTDNFKHQLQVVK